jgi:hypothetical protein
MIKFILIPGLVMLSCGSVKSNQSSNKTDTVVVEQETVLYQKDSVIELKDIPAVLPPCIKNKIDSFKLKEAHERPQRVFEYVYRGKKVYYVVMPCCDFFNEVYDGNCTYLGAPDGGFSGRGDGKIPDFLKEARNEKLVWGTAK